MAQTKRQPVTTDAKVVNDTSDILTNSKQQSDSNQIDVGVQEFGPLTHEMQAKADAEARVQKPIQ